jgi:hypothetical protein
MNAGTTSEKIKGIWKKALIRVMKSAFNRRCSG